MVAQGSQFQWQNPRPAGPAMLMLGLVLLSGGLVERLAAPLSRVLCGLAGQMLQALPSLILAVGHVGGPYSFDACQLLGTTQALFSSGALHLLATAF